MFTLKINHRSYEVDVPGDMPLLWVLRDEIGLKGGERRHIGSKGSRIGGEVLMRGKLRRIDEDRDDDAIGAPLR